MTNKQTNSQFENTVKDLQKVLETLQRATSLQEVLEESSANERVYIHHLSHVCKEILDYYEYSRRYEAYEYFRNQKKMQENKNKDL
jgi:hypothetical protein